jgi:hypothetical protein
LDSKLVVQEAEVLVVLEVMLQMVISIYLLEHGGAGTANSITGSSVTRCRRWRRFRFMMQGLQQVQVVLAEAVMVKMLMHPGQQVEMQMLELLILVAEVAVAVVLVRSSSGGSGGKGVVILSMPDARLFRNYNWKSQLLLQEFQEKQF